LCCARISRISNLNFQTFLKYIYFIGWETLLSTCYILFDESSTPFSLWVTGIKRGELPVDSTWKYGPRSGPTRTATTTNPGQANCVMHIWFVFTLFAFANRLSFECWPHCFAPFPHFPCFRFGFGSVNKCGAITNTNSTTPANFKNNNINTAALLFPRAESILLSVESIKMIASYILVYREWQG